MDSADEDKPALLNAVEIGSSFDSYAAWAVQQMAVRMSVLHGAVEMFNPPEGVDEVTVDVGGQSIRSPIIHLKFEIHVDPEARRRTDINEMVRIIEESARLRVEETLGDLDQYMGEATAAVGNNVTVRQEDISWDWMLDQFERVEWALGADGLVHPPGIHGLDSLPELTDAQQKRLAAMVQEKHDEYMARRLSRRLR